MKLLLITMGGAIDTVSAVLPVAGVPQDKSQALHTLYTLSEDRTQKDEIDHVTIGDHGAPEITTPAMSSLVDNIRQAQAHQFDRIVVTVPGGKAETVAYSVSRYIHLVNCPVVATGAELPDPKDYATNAINNLAIAAFRRADAFPRFYAVVEDDLETVQPMHTGYKAMRQPRLSQTTWGKRGLRGPGLLFG